MPAVCLLHLPSFLSLSLSHSFTLSNTLKHTRTLPLLPTHTHTYIQNIQVDIDTVEKFESLRAAEQQYFIDMVKRCKDAGREGVGGCERKSGWR